MSNGVDYQQVISPMRGLRVGAIISAFRHPRSERPFDGAYSAVNVGVFL